MKSFFKDYVELYKESGRFCKKHWKGLLVFNAVIVGAEMMYYKKVQREFNSNLEKVFSEEGKL